MRAVVQRVTSARVMIDDEVVGAIARGLLVLVGVGREDTRKVAETLAAKLVALRLFPSNRGHFDRSVSEIAGSVLLVSQFTLFGDCRRGRRPSFGRAADSEDARHVYEACVTAIRGKGVQVETGRFQADMAVESINDGPVTVLLDTDKTF